MPQYAPNGSVRLAMTMAQVFPTPAAMLEALRVDMVLDDGVTDVIGMLASGADPGNAAWLAAIFYAAGQLDRNPVLRDRLHRLFNADEPARYARPRSLSAI